MRRFHFRYAYCRYATLSIDVVNSTAAGIASAAARYAEACRR